MEHCKLIIIAAVSLDGIIGIDDQMPWRIPEDFRHFRNTTMGHMLLVGYNTYLTLPEKAFEGREYIVIGSQKREHVSRSNIYKFSNIPDVLNLLDNKNNDVEKVFVAGGAMVYDSLIDHCDECIITWINKVVPEGNKRFPIDKLFTIFTTDYHEGWQRSKTGLDYKITYYKRRHE